jgi:hypothetical protein
MLKWSFRGTSWRTWITAGDGEDPTSVSIPGLFADANAKKGIRPYESRTAIP